MSFTLISENKKEIKELDKEITIEELLDEIEVSSENVVVKKNGDIVLEETKIEEDDEIQIIQIIYGG
ncbi:bifunctional sulfur carrier protein/thiazole synthase protein [Methanobrevibacter cuticularis]|uniref:Bifunctional sulfur carrier protein/thiazole synthase protein n=1 Tax=Methanobrevibacter cuticularis TaxID=47311 RepID=A0A166DLF1_9EURY|nr:MoaD/ThiS family protein [Methanobrevibacter cuticularis]KZX15721.1 bifunctional sulfur carrier protein/thiazole synthase protein [Methanobrevibacter cuticularis]